MAHLFAICFIWLPSCFYIKAQETYSLVAMSGFWGLYGMHVYLEIGGWSGRQMPAFELTAYYQDSSLLHLCYINVYI